MSGGRPCFALVNVVGVSMFLGCGERRTGDAPATDTRGLRPRARPAPTLAGPGSAAGGTVDRRRCCGDRLRLSPGRIRCAAPPRKPRPTAARPPAAKPHPEDGSGRDTAPAQLLPTLPSPTPPQPIPPPRHRQAKRAPARPLSSGSPGYGVTAGYDGWKQFNLNCARCHGEDVLGTTIAPHLIISLKPDGPINTKELFVQTVCAGRPAKGMPAWCALGMEMDKIEAIYAYVKGRSDGKIRPGGPAERGLGG